MSWGGGRVRFSRMFANEVNQFIDRFEASMNRKVFRAGVGWGRAVEGERARNHQRHFMLAYIQTDCFTEMHHPALATLT